MSTLSVLLFQDNDELTCYPTCLSTVTELEAGSVSGVCPSLQDDAICGLIAATDISTKSTYDMWSCNSTGFPSTDPCGLVGGGSVWGGLACDGSGNANSINLVDLEIEG